MCDTHTHTHIYIYMCMCVCENCIKAVKSHVYKIKSLWVSDRDMVITFLNIEIHSFILTCLDIEMIV